MAINILYQRSNYKLLSLIFFSLKILSELLEFVQFIVVDIKSLCGSVGA